MVIHGLFGKSVSAPLSDEELSLLKKASPVFRALWTNHVRQFNEAACSVASVATVLNAARTLFSDAKAKHAITQQEILDNVNAIHWKERMSRRGHRNRRGVPINELGIAVKTSMAVYDLPVENIDVVALENDLSSLDLLKAELLARLVVFADSDDTFIIAHFNQGAFVRSWHIPHISPVGAFDKNSKRVLMLDTDVDQPEPYWVPFDRFLKGLSWNYTRMIKKYGYTGGGYVWIKMDKTRSGKKKNATSPNPHIS